MDDKIINYLGEVIHCIDNLEFFGKEIDPIELIGLCVRYKRFAKGLSQRELAFLTQTSEHFISQLERGEIKDIGLSRLIQIMTVLNSSSE